MLPFRAESSNPELLEHYLVERELADRLRNAPPEARAKLYTEVYDELFRRVPHHPQLQAKTRAEQAERRRRKVEGQLRFLRRYLDRSVSFAEIGAGDCALSLRATRYAGHVYAIDVSRQITSGVALPPNFSLVLTEGPSVPLPEGSVHFALSEELMEHLHPDDACEQLRDIHRVLAPGGRYFCSTPNRQLGPGDVSRYFDEEARGLHLKEYSARELLSLFLEAGFMSVQFLVGARGRYAAAPYPLVAALERAMGGLPRPVRRMAQEVRIVRGLLGLRVLACKGGGMAVAALALLFGISDAEPYMGHEGWS